MDAGRRVRRRHGRVLPGRRRDPRQPHRHHPDDRRPPGPGHLRARPGHDRRRGPPHRQRRGLRVARRQGRRALQPVPADVRLGVERPPPRGDGRHARSTSTATRTSPPSATTSSPRCSCSATAARRATRSTTPRRTGCRTTRPRCSCARVDTVCGVGYDRAAALGERRGAASTRSAASSPTSPCSTSRRPTTACACARCTPASPSTRCRPPPASSWSSPTTCPTTRLPTPDELELIATVIDPTGAPLHRGRRAAEARIRRRRPNPNRAARR